MISILRSCVKIQYINFVVFSQGYRSILSPYLYHARAVQIQKLTKKLLEADSVVGVSVKKVCFSNLEIVVYASRCNNDVLLETLLTADCP